MEDNDGAEGNEPRKIIVRNMKHLDRFDIYTFFTKFGVVTNVKKCKSHNVAVVTFESEEVIRKVLEACEADLLHKRLRIIVEKQRLSEKLSKMETVIDYQSSHEDQRIVTVHHLPEEILLNIFAYLTLKERVRIESVCKYWQTLNKNVTWLRPTALNLVSENEDYHPLTDETIESILSRCGKMLKELVVSPCTCHMHPTNTLESVSQYCPIIEYLQLVSVPISNTGLESLAIRGKKLKKLEIHWYNIDEEMFSKFLLNRESLECLKISKNHTLRGNCFQSLGEKIKILHLQGCSHLNNSFVRITESKCKYLQELKLHRCTNISNISFRTLTRVLDKYKTTLKVLHLYGYNTRRTVNWRRCLKPLVNLEDLSLDGCCEVDDELLSVLAKNCPKLCSLNVADTDITDAGLHYLATAPRLKKLDIGCTFGVMGSGLITLACEGKLEEVYIHSHNYISNETCQQLAVFCPDLRLLDVSGTFRIDNDLVDSFRTAIEQGALKGPMNLIIGGTHVTEDVVTCEKLKLIFDNVSRYTLDYDDGYASYDSCSDW